MAFWIAPILGALLAGWFYNSFFAEEGVEQAASDTFSDRDLNLQ